MDDYKILRDNLKECLMYWGQDIKESDVSSFHYALMERLKLLESFKLYRYMPTNYYNIRNLEKEKIHLSTNGDFNDVYEGVPASTIEELTNKDLSPLNDSAYICCFSESCNDLLMWSHYANAHKGICVEYDLKLLKDVDIIKHIFPVVYSKKRLLKVDINDLFKNLRELNFNIFHNGDNSDIELSQLLPLLVTKGGAWRNEKEWRIIYTKQELYEKSDTNYIDSSLLNIEFSCVSGVYLGFRIDNEVKENIIEIIERQNKNRKKPIEIYQTTLSNSNYELGKRKIKTNKEKNRNG